MHDKSFHKLALYAKITMTNHSNPKDGIISFLAKLFLVGKFITHRHQGIKYSLVLTLPRCGSNYNLSQIKGNIKNDKYVVHILYVTIMRSKMSNVD